MMVVVWATQATAMVGGERFFEATGREPDVCMRASASECVAAPDGRHIKGCWAPCLRTRW